MPKPPITRFANLTTLPSSTNNYDTLNITQLTQAQIDAIQPPYLTEGAVVYNTTTDELVSYIDGQWVDLGGDVVGPNISVAGDIATFADTTGKVLQDSGVSIANVPPLLLTARLNRLNASPQYSNSTVNEIGNLGHIRYTNGIGIVFVDSLMPVEYISNNYSGSDYQVCSLFTGGLPSSSTTPSALVELQTNTGALLLSRLTSSEMGALTAPVPGMIVYNSTANAFEGYVSGTWTLLSGGGTVTSITAGTGLSGGTITTSGTIAIANTAVTGGSYTYGNFTVNAQGQLTAASSGATPLVAANNLSDLTNTTTARSNLGLTNIATQTVTQYSVLVGGASNAITSIAMTNGQLLIGSTGANPVAAVPTNGTNISWVTGAGSLTANISGQIALTNGGTNANLTASNGGIFYSTASAAAILAGTATANQVLLSGSSATPAWSTATYPATTTINQLLYSSAANIVAGLATANSGVLITSSGGVPSIGTTLPSGVQTNITSLGTITAGTWNATTIAVNKGGTGLTSTTAYSVLCGGTTSTGALQSVVSLGTSGQVLTSQGASALPIWTSTGSGTVTSITAGTGLSGGTITTSGTIAIANTAVTAASYTYGSFTVNAQGQLTAASSGATPVTSITGTANEVLANGTSGSAQTGAITLTTPQAIGTTSSPTFGSLTISTTSTLIGDVSCEANLLVNTIKPYSSSIININAANISIGSSTLPISNPDVPVQIFAAASTLALYGAMVNSSTYGMLIGLQNSTGVIRMVNTYPLQLIVNNSTIGLNITSAGVLTSLNNTLDNGGNMSIGGSITAGTWHGSVIALTYGGTNANLTASNGGIFYSTASAGAILAGTATASQMLLSGSSTAPTWSSYTMPSTLATGDLLYASSSTAISRLAAGTSGYVLTMGSSIPQWTSGAAFGVSSITGTANQVLVNGTSGSAQVGAITLTTPQAIGTSSSPSFAGLTVTGTTITINNNVNPNITFTGTSSSGNINVTGTPNTALDINTTNSSGSLGTAVIIQYSSYNPLAITGAISTHVGITLAYNGGTNASIFGYDTSYGQFWYDSIAGQNIWFGSYASGITMSSSNATSLYLNSTYGATQIEFQNSGTTRYIINGANGTGANSFYIYSNIHSNYPLAINGSTQALTTLNNTLDNGSGGSTFNGNMTIATNSNTGGNYLNIRNTNAGSSAYTPFAIGNDLNLGAFVLFTNSSTRTTDGGAGNTTLRTDHGQLIISSAVSPLQFQVATSNKMSLDSSGNMILAGKLTSYNGITTAGFGLSAYVLYSITSNSSSATIITYTVPAGGGTYEIGGDVGMQVYTSGNISFPIVFTPLSTGSSQTGSMYSVYGGSVISQFSGLTDFPFTSFTITCKGSTTITIAATITATLTAITSLWIRQVS